MGRRVARWIGNLREFRLFCMGLLAGWLVRAWFRTLRCRFQVLGSLRRGRWPVDQPCIIAAWHDTLLLPVWMLGPSHLHTLISQSDDGEIIARICHALGWRPIRGSSSRGAMTALRAILLAAKTSPCFQFAMTVDGPRGPRRKCKEGVVYLASRLGIPIVPVGAFAERGWRANSWDRFFLPIPFSRAALVADELIPVPSGLDDDGLQRHCRLVESAIDRAEAAARSLALGLPSNQAAQTRPVKAA